MAWKSYTNLHSVGGTGFQPVHAQAEACGYQKLPYECDLVLPIHISGNRRDSVIPTVRFGNLCDCVLDI